LVNNLDLKLIRADGGTNLPYVMPFVGNWSQASMSSNAITGTNNVDNVEQVYLASPSGTGVYQAVVSYQGTLSNNLQAYSLLVSGVSDTPAPALPVTVDSVSPGSGYARTFNFDVSGTLFATNAALRFTRSGFSDVVATNVQVFGSTSLKGSATFPTNSSGSWHVMVTNPASQAGVLTNGFTILPSLAAENFDGVVSGWTGTGTNNSWSLVTNNFRSSSNSYFASAPASRSTTYLTSPSYPVPAGTTNIQIRFWHSYNFQTSRDGGRLELSTNGGTTWFAMESTNNIDETFSSNAYNGTINSTTSDFNGKSVWTGASAGFVETVISINNSAKYAGGNLRIRWVLASNGTIASAGWYIDDLVVLGSTPPVNSPPTVISPATTSATSKSGDYDLLEGASLSLSVRASDDGGGESGLTYMWSSDAPPGPDVPYFTPNTTNAAKDTTVYFSKLGDYALTVRIRDGGGLETSSTVHVRVLPKASAIIVSPSSATLVYGTTQTFSAELRDQFNGLINPQPSLFNWSVNDGGLINSNGVFTATMVGGPYTLSVETGGFFDTADITITKAPQSISFSTATSAVAGESRTLTANSSSGLPVTFSVSPSSVATISGNTLNFLTAGTATVTATQTGNANYLTAPEVSLVITATNPTFLSIYNSPPASDADGDGIPALVEYALGGSTNSNDQNLLPQMSLSNSSLSISAVIRTNDTNLLVYPEASTDLATPNSWTTSGFTTNTSNQTNVPAGFQRRQYQFNAGTNPRAFLKLTIQQQ